MITGFSEFINHIKKENNKIINPKFVHLVKSIDFMQKINENENLDDIKEKIEKCDFIIIDKYENLNTKYNVVCFLETLLIIDKSILKKILQSIKTKEIYFLNNCFEDIQDSVHDKYDLEIFHYEIRNFTKQFELFNIENEFWKNICPCLSAYLIKKSYLKCQKDREKNFELNPESFYIKKRKEFKKDEFIELRTIGSGSNSIVYLFYHLKSEQLYAVKIHRNKDEKLFNREMKNLENVQHPFLPQFYGTIKNKWETFFVMEYIHGQTLENIKNQHLGICAKLKIIIEIIYIIKFLHENNLIYRDLKPSNVMLDMYHHAILIDFDRLIENNLADNEDHTKDFNHCFIAPEIVSEFPQKSSQSKKSDIYSIGKMIGYIITEIEPKDNNNNDIISELEKLHFYLPDISSTYEKSIETDIDKRISIEDLINYFKYLHLHVVYPPIYCETPDDYETLPFKEKTILNIKAVIEMTIDLFEKTHFFVENLLLAENQNDPISQFVLGGIYSSKNDIKKSNFYFQLAEEHNDSGVQLRLGNLYKDGIYKEKDMNKAINYYLLASKQNNPFAQFMLGKFYFEGIYLNKDDDKAFYYLNLAAESNDPEILTNIGALFINIDIEKAIYYFKLASDLNYQDALTLLGYIYSKETRIPKDINKAIYYFSRASELNDSRAQYQLGLIYEEGIYVKRDIIRAFEFYIKAHFLNNSDASFRLGIMYFEGKYIEINIYMSLYFFGIAQKTNTNAGIYLGTMYLKEFGVEKDIKKGIGFLKLSADQNNNEAQYHLGKFYFKGIYIEQNIQMALHYLMFAVNQNHTRAIFFLGKSYLIGRFIDKNIEKSIYYLKLAAKLNDVRAQFLLGCIYYDGTFVPRDIFQAIYYFELAANQNHAKAQNSLGHIYIEGFFIRQNIQKSLYYFKLAANQELPVALYNIGLIYLDGIGIPQDINKGINYLQLAAIKKCVYAQIKLGDIFSIDNYNVKNISKSISYYEKAAIQGDKIAQYFIGRFYFNGKYVKKNINLAMLYFVKSANNGYPDAKLTLADFYLEGKYIKRDINKAIHYYKDLSSLNNAHAKNNLGVIYKTGYNGIKPNTDNAKILFNEAINQSRDHVAMFNLAIIYLEEDNNKYGENYDKAMKLLIESSNENLISSFHLSSLLFAKYGSNEIKIFQNVLKKYCFTDYISLSKKIYDNLFGLLGKTMQNRHFWEIMLRNGCDINLIYIHEQFILLSDLDDQNSQKNNNHIIKDINNQFYLGFGYDIYQPDE